jgi:Mn2+/Fe2+ NRAMP family transporter
VLVIANFATFPMIYFAHASIAPTASGAVPSLPGGLNATILLLVVAVVGTTVEPWQLFFQQSNVVDKAHYATLDELRAYRHRRGRADRGDRRARAHGRVRVRAGAHECVRELHRHQRGSTACTRC